jgi:hypothetical protein
MANVDFYAAKEDLRSLLHFIFEETDLRVFESYSEPDSELREFSSYHELAAAFKLGIDEHGHGSHVLLQLWSPSVTTDVEVIRFALKPTKARPHTFRHNISGIGLIQFYLGGLFQNMITDSHYGHWSEAGARQRAGGNPDAVDWDALSKLSGRIQQHIRKRTAVAKVKGRSILPAAFEALKSGIDLRYGPATFHARSPEIQILRQTEA